MTRTVKLCSQVDEFNLLRLLVEQANQIQRIVELIQIKVKDS